MRRSAGCRALIGLWSLWLVAVFSQPVALHSCPLHGEHGTKGSTMPASHAGHAGHAGGATNHSPHSPARCTCIGLCCCAAPVGCLDARAAEILVSTATTVGVALPDARVIASQRAHAHPFANGPPRSRSLTFG